MKRLSIIALCLLIALSIVLSACTKQEDKSDQGQKEVETAQTEPATQEKETEKEEGADAEDGSIVTPAGTFPIAKEKVILSVFTQQHPGVSDFINNEFTKWYEEYTNVHLEWDLVPPSDVGSKLNLILASGDYPDMIIDPWVLSSTQVMIYGAQGVFIPLNDLIEEYGIEIKKVFSEYPEALDMVTMPDGNIYALPQIDDCFHCKYPNKFWVYQPWLDTLGLEIPTNTEDFYQVLKAFKENDPNGNNKRDEIPLTGTVGGNNHPDIMTFLMNAFIYTDPTFMKLNNGKVETVFDKPEWKEGLKYLNMLYNEGLIAPESFTQDSNQLKQLNAEDVRVGVFPQLAPYNVFPNTLGDERWVNYKSIPPLEGPNGLRVARTDVYGIGPMNSFVITEACEYPEVAFRWADALLSQELTLRKYYGRPDQEWRYAEAGEVGLNGEPAIWASLAKSGGEVDFPTDKSWMHIGPHFRNSTFRLGQAVVGDPNTHTGVVLYRETKQNYEPYTADKDIVLPPLIFTEEQSNEVADLDKTIKDFVNEMFARFVTGDADIENDWDFYLEELKNMNLERYIELHQEAYDLMWGNK